MIFTYTLYIVGKTYSDRQLAVIIRPLKVDRRNVCRTKFIIHLPTNFLLIVTVFVCRYRSFFLQIVNNSSFTSKRVHVSSANDSSISSDSLRFLQFFPSTASIEFPNVRETEKGLKPIFVLSSYDSFFSLHENYLANPNGESVGN